MAKSKWEVDDGTGPAFTTAETLEFGCSVKQIKKKGTLIEAAETAMRIFAGNRPQTRGLSRFLSGEALEEVLKPESIAVLVDKKWDPSVGVKLGVTFMENTVQELRDKIISHMNAWNTIAGSNVAFAYSKSGGEVRLSRGGSGYWSYLGTDILHIPKNEATMNLEGFVLKTPESEYKRVVRHETGHTLGFPHEHMRKDLVALLDVAKTIAYFERTQGWSEQEVREQVLVPLSEDSLFGTPADKTSIMCYQLPGSITKDGNPIAGGTDIDPSDAAFAAKLYPKAVTPVPVDPGTEADQAFAINVAGKTIKAPAGYKLI